MKKYCSFAAFATLIAVTSFSFSACGGDDDDTLPIDPTLKPEGLKAVAVDLGLPSGTKWADRNIGADKPEAYGNYFAWGETDDKSEYDWSSYAWGGDATHLTKYCTESIYGKNGFADDKTVLEPDDDAAHVKWGGQWRMPTEAEFEELKLYTTHEWVENYNGTGVAGELFTASNGNHLFLPAAGHRFDSYAASSGLLGEYWTSSLNVQYPYNACLIYSGFDDKTGVNDLSVAYFHRTRGYPVRPVRK